MRHNVTQVFMENPDLWFLATATSLIDGKKFRKEFQKSMMRHIWRIFLFQVQSGINKQFFRGI